MTVTNLADTGAILRSEVPLGSYLPRLGDALVRWAAEAPDRAHLAEREGAGWREITYSRQLARVREVAAGLLARGASSERPVAILCENSIDYGTLVLACMHAGVPSVPLSAGYARSGASPERIRTLLDIVTPSFVFAPGETAAALAAAAYPAAVVLRALEDLGPADPRSADAAFEKTGPDTIAKILFTSGSTGTPKGVVVTQRMMCANQKMLALVWPEVVDEPTLLDWAPWSHVASGNKIFNLAIVGGGTLYVDDGKPVATAFARTLDNLKHVAPTFYFNVPRGYGMLVDALEGDAALARHFFSRLRRCLSAGASLPDGVRERIAALGRRHAGREIPVVSCWGATETAPMATAIWGPRPAEPQSIGTPVPGVELKLAPLDDRFELRVKGPTVTPGYFRNPAATAAAFDEQGFYRSGDAAELLDPADPSRGLMFAGRIGENFKLSTGTWVNAGAVRLGILDAGDAPIEDVVVCGADRDDLAVLVFVDLLKGREVAGDARADLAALAGHPAVRARLLEALRAYNGSGGGSSARVARALVLSDGPRAAEGELTDKGTVNQRRALVLRAESVAALYRTPFEPQIIRVS